MDGAKGRPGLMGPDRGKKTLETCQGNTEYEGQHRLPLASALIDQSARFVVDVLRQTDDWRRFKTFSALQNSHSGIGVSMDPSFSVHVTSRLSQMQIWSYPAFSAQQAAWK